MAWAISTRSMERVGSLAVAAKVWASATPWRNEHHSWRQLDQRRASHKRIVKLSDDRGYQCVLYSTALVTYFTDGTVALRCYDTQSSTAFAWCVKPEGCTPTSAQGRMFWRVQTDAGVQFLRQGAEPLLLKPVRTGVWQVVSSAELMHEMVNNNLLRAAVREQVKPYAAWHAVTERLRGKPFLPTWHAFDHRYALGLQPLLGDPVQYLKLAEMAEPGELIKALYFATGAVYKAPVPYDRLPRNFA